MKTTIAKTVTTIELGVLKEFLKRRIPAIPATAGCGSEIEPAKRSQTKGSKFNQGETQMRSQREIQETNVHALRWTPAHKGPRAIGSRLLLVMLTLVLAYALPLRAGGVVTQCDEPHFKQALYGGGLVTFACSGTIEVLGGTVEISNGSTTIDGSGHHVAISGGGVVRVFLVDSGATLTLNNLTIANGNANDVANGGAGHGGGVLVAQGVAQRGSLVVVNCIFTGNQSSNGGGAIWADGDADITHSNFSGNSSFGPGGAIGNTGILNVKTSTLFFNISYQQGGAIATTSVGPAQIDSSTFSDNRALGLGGAISTQAGWLTVTNTTFTGNETAGFGAAIDNFGAPGIRSSANILYSTFFNNNVGAGQISSRGSAEVTLFNTIIANPLPEPTINCYQPYNSNNFVDYGGNVRWPTTDPTCLGSYGDPKLGPLANNGGPTETMSLALGSAAIDAGIYYGFLTVDQRGVARSNPPDAGAFESTYDKP